MHIDKAQILSLLTDMGKGDQVPQAEQELPDQVDPEAHAGLLEKFGLDPKDLIAKFVTGGIRNLF